MSFFILDLIILEELSATSAQAESVKPYSLKINMPDKYDLLYAYDEAVRYSLFAIH